MKVVAVAQARMGSTRLPGKVLKDLGGRPALDWVVEAARKAPGVHEVVVATSVLDRDQPIVDWCHTKGVRVSRGDEIDVLSRFLGAAHETKADILVRLTGDCPLLDYNVIGEVIRLRGMKNAEYASNIDPPTYPDGLDVEVFTRNALEIAHREAVRGTDRDTVTRWMVRNRYRLPAANLTCPLPDLVHERWVLDSPEDYDMLQKLVEGLRGEEPTLLNVLEVLDRDPDIRKINSKYTRNERFYEALLSEPVKRTYRNSSQHLVAAQSLIPLGAQTFSKSHLQFPDGASPLYVTHGDGGYVYDIDGNDYIDLVGALLPNVLGYRDNDVDQAVRDQLSRGVSLSLATPLELEVAEKISKLVPSAEMVRFGKNGSDVTNAAIRLARYCTSRDAVIVGGYHGWHEWSAPNLRGVVPDYRRFSLPLCDGKLLRQYSQNLAAVIVEPEFYSAEQLQDLREQCDEIGALLIFDEVISGFRCDLGGIQHIVGVTPDITTLGKALGNGMPISAVVGKEEYMSKIRDVAFSGTFFGECLSLAAASACLDKLERNNVPKYFNEVGAFLRSEINILLGDHNVPGIKLHGELSLNRIKFTDRKLQTLFMQEMAKNGVLIIATHGLCWAHRKPEINKILTAWDKTLYAIAHGQDLEGDIIRGEPIR